jgi:ribulose-5-phosphate 4-epimerase/fuculose-1-phosphate aldolase
MRHLPLPAQDDPAMAHELQAADPSRLSNIGEIDWAALRQARIDLAACFRMAARLGLEEGICNHFSAMVPGRDDLFLVNPYGLAFAEVTASSLLVCDFHGNVIDSDGKPEATAFYIHARLHKQVPRVRAAFHTHMPNATALSMVEGQPLVWAGQSALKFYGRTAVDDAYNGLALDEAEGDRIAATLGDADIVFLRNHGVMVCGPTIAEAWDDLYYLERAAEVQVKALSTGRTLRPVPAEIARRTYQQMREGDAESARLHLESVKRQLMRQDPAFAA